MQVVASRLEGRLANVTYILFKLVAFCDEFGVDRGMAAVDGGHVALTCSSEYNSDDPPGKFFHDRAEFFWGVRDIVRFPDEWRRICESARFSEVGYSLEDAKKTVSSGGSPMFSCGMVSPDTGRRLMLFGESFFSRRMYDEAKDHMSAMGCNPKTSVALHVRRTDFKVYHDGSFLQDAGSLNRRVSDVSGSTDVVVFSDDIEWCRENIRRSNGRIVFNTPGTDMQDVMRMAACSSVMGTHMSWYSNLGSDLGKYAREHID